MVIFIGFLVAGVVFAIGTLLTLGPFPRHDSDYDDYTDPGSTLFDYSSSDDGGSFFDSGD